MITKELNCLNYVNPKNGKLIYSKNSFKSKDVNLFFINGKSPIYKQFSNDEFVPNLSILDILMHNKISEIQIHLSKYSLE